MSIGTLRETLLHAALKRHFQQPGDETEVKVDGFVADILRGQNLIEIQTHNFSALKRKFRQLLETRAIRLVHPIAVEKWITRLDAKGRVLSRRKSPKHGRLEDLFVELVSLPDLPANPNFSLEIVLIHEEEFRRPAPRSRRRWRKDWTTSDRRLLDIVESIPFESLADYTRFLPASLPAEFTNADLAHSVGVPVYLAQKLTYCLRTMRLIERVGTRQRAMVYARSMLDF